MGTPEDIVRIKAAFRWQLCLSELEDAHLAGTKDPTTIHDELKKMWPNIIKARSWCVERAREDVRAAILCSKIAGCAGHLLDQEHGRQLLIEWREDAIEAVTQALAADNLPQSLRDDMVHDLLGHLTYLGYLHMTNGNMARARGMLERAARESEDYRDPAAEGTARLHLAMVALREENLEEAETQLEMVLTTADLPPQNMSLPAAAHNLLGVIADRRNEAERAVGEYTEALRGYEEGNQHSGLVTALANRAGSLVDLGRLDEAKEDLSRADDALKGTGALQLRALCSANQARLLAASKDGDHTGVMGLLDNARSAYATVGDIPQLRRIDQMRESILQGALASSTTPLDPGQRGHILRQLADIASERNDTETEANWLDQLLETALASNDRLDEMEARAKLGHVAIRGKDFELAAERLESALAVAASLPEGEYAKAECEIRIALGQAYRHVGQYGQADDQYQIAETIASKRADNEAKWRASGNRALNNVERQRYNEAISKLRAVISEIGDSGEYRLLGQARFNLAYAYARSGDLALARSEGQQALRVLEMIGDDSAEDARRQMDSWEPSET